MEKQNIPVLRFSGFEGEWKKEKLGDVSDVRDGTHDSPKYHEQGFPFITSKNLLLNGSIDFENVNFICEEDYEKINRRSKVDVNDILFGMIGTIGNCVLVKTDGFAIKNVALLKEKSELVNTFLIQYLKASSINQQFFEQNTGGTQKFLSLSTVRNLIVSFPSQNEQQKIASFFTAIDQKISQLKRKKTLLEQYKKGVMQKIFTQEPDEVGSRTPLKNKQFSEQIRFKDDKGQEFPKWEKKSLKDVAEIKYGKDQKEIACENGNYPILGTGGEMGRTNEFLSDKPSVLIGRKGTIDKPLFIDTPFWTVDTLFYTNVLPNVNPKWLYYRLTNINWYKYNEASGVPSLSSSTISKIPINLPSLPEQTKITNFLSAIDNKINHTQKQIEKAEVWKKGLMQQMFV